MARLTAETRGGRGAARRRLPVWVQVGLGCGLASVLMVGMVAGGAYVVYRKGTSVMDRAWKELQTTTERLRTAESTKALYRGNPGLSEIYATEGEFLKAVEGWRPKLGEIPSERPPLKSLLRDQQMVQVHRNLSDGHETIRIKYGFPSGAVLEMETDEGQLTNLLLK